MNHVRKCAAGPQLEHPVRALLDQRNQDRVPINRRSQLRCKTLEGIRGIQDRFCVCHPQQLTPARGPLRRNSAKRLLEGLDHAAQARGVRCDVNRQQTAMRGARPQRLAAHASNVFPSPADDNQLARIDNRDSAAPLRR
jgi:hypothetical protein